MLRDFLKNKSKLFVPSIADVLFFTLFLYLSFSVGRGLLGDADTGYHIRAGEYILDTFSIPRHDIFSYLTPPLPWTAHEWLSEVIMALVHKPLGLTGVVILFSFLISLVYSLLFRMIRKNEANILFAVSIVLLVMVSSMLHWLARPHIFSLLLLVIWYHLLDSFEYRHHNYLYLLPPTMLLWVNLHGGFLAGFILIGIYLFGNFVRFFFSKAEERILYKRKTKLLTLTTAFCLLASLINPYTYDILLFPFKLISKKFIMDHVIEFLSPNFHELGVMPFKYLLLLMILIIGISRRRLNIIELALIIVFTNMALHGVRFITLFGIVAAPILARQVDLLFKQGRGKFVDFFQRRATNIASVDASTRGDIWPVAAVLIALFFAATGGIEYKFDAEKKPVAAVDFLKKVHLKGNMFNNDEFGDYIIYSAYPQYRVFFDGRSDMYGEKRMKEYYKVAHFKSGWEEIMEKYNINWIIYDADSPLSRFLMERKDWKLIYADKVANIFVRNVPENQDLINQYSNVKPVVVENKN
jgi:hypothetical protein